MGQPAFRQAAARQGQHIAGSINAKALFDARREFFQKPARAAANIQQAPQPAFRQGLQQRGFKRLGRQAQGAGFIPIGAMAAEAIGSNARPFRRQPRRGTTIRCKQRVFFRQACQDLPGEISLRRHLEPGIGAFRRAGQQAGFDQKLQMARQPGLGLAENGH